MKRVLVTGGAGFVGSHTCRVLLEANCDVAILIRSQNSLRRLHDVADQITFLECDLSNSVTLRRILTDWKPDACIHLAWYAEPGRYLQSIENLSSLQSSLALLRELVDVGCRHVTIAGTCAEYSATARPLKEDDAARPDTIYAATKLALNLAAQQVAALAGISLAWARLFYLYGPHEDERRLVPSLIRTLARGSAFPATSGEQVRDYLHVEDVGRALWAITEKEVTGIVNVSSGIPVTIRALMETIGEIMARNDLIKYGELPYRDWEPPFVCGDNQKLRTAADWQPRYDTIRTGLSQTVKWWQAQIRG